MICCFYSTYLVSFVTLACTKTSSQLPLDRCYALFKVSLTRMVGRIVTTDHCIPSLYKGRQCTFCQCNPPNYAINNINVHTTVYVHVLRLAEHTSCNAPPTNWQCRCGDLSTLSEYRINKHLVCKTWALRPKSLATQNFEHEDVFEIHIGIIILISTLSMCSEPIIRYSTIDIQLDSPCLLALPVGIPYNA